MHQQVLRMPSVLERVGLGRSTLYAMIARNEFPTPVRLGIRCSGWIASEVDAWIEARTAASREAKPQ